MTIEPLQCGAGKADITPPAGTPMGGYANRLSPCQGVLDPLSARALLLHSGDRSAIILTLDALAVSAERARTLAEDASGACGGLVRPEDVRVVCSHTHSGVDLSGMFGAAGPVARYFEQVRAAARSVLWQAHASLGVVHVRRGATSFPIGRNRRLRPGHARVSERERAQGEHVDPMLTVLRFERPVAQGYAGTARPVATLFHTACHPVCLGPENVLASADFAGIAAQTLEALTGAPALFLNGACGNVTPLIGRGSSYSSTRDLGESVARAVSEVDLWGLPDPTGLSVSPPTLAELPLGCHFETPADVERSAEWLRQQETGFVGWADVVSAWLQRMRSELATGSLPRSINIPLGAIGLRAASSAEEDLTFVFIGAEVFNEYQLWQPPGVRLVGYAGGEGCYIPTSAALDGGGYEVSTAPVFYGLPCAPGPGAERALLDAIAAAARPAR